MEFNVRYTWVTDSGVGFRIGDKVSVERLDCDKIEGKIDDMDDNTLWLNVDGVVISFEQDDIWEMCHA